MFTRSPESIISAALECWHRIKPESGLPSRKAVSPRLLTSLLPYVCLLDVVPGNPPDFRFRLMGEHLRDFYGLNVTGMLQSSFVTAAPGEQAPIRDALIETTVRREPVRVETQIPNVQGLMRNLSAVMCPLSEDGVIVTSIIAAGVYVNAPQN